jgi:V8-like Glu-specific endopeptidase
MAFPVGAVEELLQDQMSEEMWVEGEPGFAPGGPPDANAERMARRQYPEEWEALKDELDAVDQMMFEEAGVPFETLGTAGIYTSYRGNYSSQMWKQFPYKAVGKLYITGVGYCTASVISPNNIIVTAAHCVYDTDANRWYTGWTFVPAAKSSTAPYGRFPWRTARVLTNWINAPDSLTGRRYDVAVIRLGNNSAGRSVKSYTGYLGRSWNYPYVQHHHAIGYPDNLSSGLYTYICAAESFSWSTDVVGMGCDMMHGSSGGPWIRVFKPYTSGANNYVNAVVSGSYSGAPANTFYGPRFSDSNIVILCTDEGC